MTKKYLILFLLLALALAGCSAASESVAEATDLPAAPSPTPLPLPEAGKATVTGRVLDIDGKPLAGIRISLAEVVRGVEGRGGAFILDSIHSPYVYTDAQGYFVFTNTKAAEYVIVTGDVELTGIYEIIHMPNGEARVFEMPADQITDVGELKVSIQPPQLMPTWTPGAPGVYPAPAIYPNP